MIELLTGDSTIQIREYVDNQARAPIKKINPQNLKQSELLDLIKAQDLFSTKQTLVIHDLSHNKTLWAAMEDLIDEIQQDPDLQLFLIETKVDGRSKIIKNLKKNNYYKEFASPKDLTSAIRFLQTEAAKHQIQVKTKVAELIINKVGFDSWSIIQALKKLAIINSEITIDLVEQYIAPSLEVSSFDLVEAILAGQSAKVLRLLNDLELVDANLIQLLALINSQFVDALIIITSRQTNLINDFKIHPFVVKKLSQVTRKLNFITIKQIIKQLDQLSFQIRTEKIDKWALAKTTLLKITNLVAVAIK